MDNIAIYNAMINSIDNTIEEILKKKEELLNDTNVSEKSKNSKISKLDKLIEVQKELREKLNVANDYFDNTKLKHVAKIKEYITQARESILSAEDYMTDFELEDLAYGFINVQEHFSRENTIFDEIEKSKEDMLKYVRTNGLKNQTYSIDIGEEKVEEPLEEGINKLYKGIILSTYDYRQSLEDNNLINNPYYSKLINKDLDIIDSYREYLESGRLEKVNSNKPIKKLFRQTIKSSDETAEIELKEANELFKIRTAVTSVMRLITEYGYKDEFKKTMAILDEINIYCDKRFDKLIEQFKNSNFHLVKDATVVELKKDKHIEELKELETLFFEAYLKIGAEHERLVDLAKTFAMEHEIQKNESLMIEAKAKNDALSKMIADKKIESEEELKEIISDSQVDKIYGVTLNLKDEEDERKNEIRRAQRKKDDADEAELRAKKQAAFDLFMQRRRGYDPSDTYLNDYNIDYVTNFDSLNYLEESSSARSM